MLPNTPKRFPTSSALSMVPSAWLAAEATPTANLLAHKITLAEPKTQQESTLHHHLQCPLPLWALRPQLILPAWYTLDMGEELQLQLLQLAAAQRRAGPRQHWIWERCTVWPLWEPASSLVLPLSCKNGLLVCLFVCFWSICVGASRPGVGLVAVFGSQIV